MVNFSKPAWCSNCSKFVRSRVNIQVYLIAGLGSKVSLIALDEIPDVCSSSFFDKVSQMGPRPTLGSTESVFCGPRAEAEQRPKLGIFIDTQDATSVESLLKGPTARESLRSTVLSDTDKSC